MSIWNSVTKFTKDVIALDEGENHSLDGEGEEDKYRQTCKVIQDLFQGVVPEGEVAVDQDTMNSVNKFVEQYNQMFTDSQAKEKEIEELKSELKRYRTIKDQWNQKDVEVENKWKEREVEFQGIQEDLKQSFQERLNNKNDQIVTLVQKVENFDKELKAKDGIIVHLEKEMEEKMTVLEQFKFEEDNLHTIIKTMEHEMNELQNERSLLLEVQEKYELLKNEHSVVKTKYESEKLLFKSRESIISNLTTSLEDLVNRINDDSFVDRRVIFEFLCQYLNSFQTEREIDQFQLLCSVLRLDDNNQQKLNIIMDNIRSNPNFLVDNVKNYPQKLNRHSLSELWVEFLMKKTEK